MMDDMMKAWLKEEIKKFFDIYWNDRPVPRGILHGHLMTIVSVQPEDYLKTSRMVLEALTLDSEVLEGYTLVRGRHGGLVRDKGYAAKDAEATRAMFDACVRPGRATEIVLAPAINNHVCPSCGNDKCSKTERSCWKCGGKLS